MIIPRVGEVIAAALFYHEFEVFYQHFLGRDFYLGFTVVFSLGLMVYLFFGIIFLSFGNSQGFKLLKSQTFLRLDLSFIGIFFRAARESRVYLMPGQDHLLTVNSFPGIDMNVE